MGYLITHIAISLVFALLLGLALGWLLWGYMSRQRVREVETLRQRMADLHIKLAREMADPTRLAVAEGPGMLSDLFENQPAMREFDHSNVIDNDLTEFGSEDQSEFGFTPHATARNDFHRNDFSSRIDFSKNDFVRSESPERSQRRNAFFADEEAEPELKPFIPTMPVAEPVAVAPDVEAHIRDAHVQNLEEQVRELESFRDRLPVLQADLSDAIAGRRSAETKFQEAKNDFEVRSRGLLSQIRDYEAAAAEWDRLREEFESERVEQIQELSSVKATLRDLQNSQRPQAVNGSGSVVTASTSEVVELRERYQKAIREREAIAVEFEFWKQNEAQKVSASSNGHHGELQDALRQKDTLLAEQAARVESLLWRVAELEPFSAELPRREETVRRQESEIAGHVAMHAENTQRLQLLQQNIDKLQSTTIPVDELQRIVAEHQAEVRQLSQEHDQRLAELHHALNMKDNEILEHVAARHAQVNVLNNLQTRIVELEEAKQRLHALEKLIVDRDSEIRGLLAAHGDTQREMERWKEHSLDLEPVAGRVPQLQSLLADHAAELQRLKESHSDKDGQLVFLQERLNAMSSRLSAHQQRLIQLEPLAVRAPELEQKLAEVQHQSQQRLKALDERHHNELTRLKVNSAQRIRRLRQGITTFKT